MTCVLIDNFASILEKIKAKRGGETLIMGSFKEEWRDLVKSQQFPFEFPFTFILDQGAAQKLAISFQGMSEHEKAEPGVLGLNILYSLLSRNDEVLKKLPAFEVNGLSLMTRDDSEFFSKEDWWQIRGSVFVIMHYICHFDTYYEKLGRAERKRLAKGTVGLINHTDMIVRLMTRTDSRCKSTNQVKGNVRYHLCRGHYKNHMGKERIWIKPHWKGNKELGTVRKDYKL